MYDYKYLLSVKELAREEWEGELWCRVLQKLDAERLQKVHSIKVPKKRASCAGAGLMVQWWLNRENANKAESVDKVESDDKAESVDNMEENRRASKWQMLTVEKLLEDIKEPVEHPVKYGTWGKPYFRESNLFFNISHSGDYVAAVFSEREIGVDIQLRKKMDMEKLSKRFFSVREQEYLHNNLSKETWEKSFFRLWTRKEAYGKMTGEGIIPVIDEDFHDLDAGWLKGVHFEEYELGKEYQVTCCARKNGRCKDRSSIS